MTSVAHISDLHFGTEVAEVAACLQAELTQLKPSLVVVSGDLTQRARRAQYQAAREYLDLLPKPQLVVPGNHDIPLYDVASRFLAPLARFRRFIHEDVNPFHLGPEIAVLGINTARSFTWVDGRISFEQMELIKQRFCGLDRPVFKIMVTHHPFIPPPGEEHAGVRLVGRAQHALKVIEECDVGLLLAGHLHHGYAGDVRTYYPGTRRAIMVVQAGTAISRRVRREPNAYNLITLDGSALRVSVRTFSGGRFEETLSRDLNEQNGG